MFGEGSEFKARIRNIARGSKVALDLDRDGVPVRIRITAAHGR